ncbi:hypothetical protein ETH_00037620 [Eimeria tenella]|uniref:Uncharacterized protein n=1 Tax=Eimeria tenella TaxID=5802 RepID=U6L4Y6_EIMTE|nr:hypothetical protein ETH_00037620 [Eimeria tenella]CDJ44278.1 hypothetical protein ETH_00037620 [Eimeria tenella]|eukprot:XP_013235027.1 hypothetical protein ETH_00037620 [Eimeria tenella]
MGGPPGAPPGGPPGGPPPRGAPQPPKIEKGAPGATGAAPSPLLPAAAARKSPLEKEREMEIEIEKEGAPTGQQRGAPSPLLQPARETAAAAAAAADTAEAAAAARVYLQLAAAAGEATEEPTEAVEPQKQ